MNELVEKISNQITELKDLRELFANGSLKYVHFKFFILQMNKTKKFLEKAYNIGKKSVEKRKIWKECFGGDDVGGC
jgi:hypothetical protein